MWERIFVILRKEFIQALREPRMRVLLFVPPMVQLIVFGFAVNLDVDHARIAWMDMDRTPESRNLRDRFTGSGRFDIVSAPGSEEDVQRTLDRGEAQAVVRILPGFARDTARGRTAEVQVLIDGTNSNTASLVSSYAGSIIAEYSVDVMERQQRVKVLTRSPGSPVSMAAPQVTARSRVWFNPDLYSRNYFVPGVIANIIMMVTLMLTALGIVREKEIGTMEQLMVTPVRPIELMLGKTLPFALVGLLDVVLVTLVAFLVFRIPLHGSFLLLLFCAAAVPDDDARGGPVPLHDFADAAAGDDGELLLFDAGVHAERLRISHPQHAGGGAVPDVFEPGALLHRDRARHLPERRGSGRVVAADDGDGGVRRRGAGLERDALPEETGLVGFTRRREGRKENTRGVAPPQGNNLARASSGAESETCTTRSSRRMRMDSSTPAVEGWRALVAAASETMARKLCSNRSAAFGVGHRADSSSSAGSPAL